MIKGVVFNTDMVTAVLDGYKTQMRRVIKVPPKAHCVFLAWDEATFQWYRKASSSHEIFEKLEHIPLPYRVGDILYVKETWGIAREQYGGVDCKPSYVYRANCSPVEAWGRPWRPSTQMPKDAARIFLKVTGITPKKLHDITEEDIAAEGIDSGISLRSFEDNDLNEPVGGYREFAEYWDKNLSAKDKEFYSWDSNPWVWVITFERVNKLEVLQ